MNYWISSVWSLTVDCMHLPAGRPAGCMVVICFSVSCCRACMGRAEACMTPRCRNSNVHGF